MTAGFPLAGVRVLDLSRVLAGPVCCQLLADLGADVVKVERPGTGDDTRHWGPPFLADDGPSAYFLSCNRGKRSLVLDLSQPAGRAVLDDLVRRADILVENFLPDSLDKLGLSPERLHGLNPGLVSCSISGYGRTGPLADRPGYDLTIQATMGWMSLTGEPDGSPQKVAVAVTDVLTGLYAATSALAGLYARGQGQPARAFDLALADCALASLVNLAQATLITGERPTRYGNMHAHIVPYGCFATADGHLILAIGNDAQWQKFCRAVDREDLARDERFATNPARIAARDSVIAAVSAIMRTQGTAAWQAQLTAADVPHSLVLSLDEALAQPQVAAREMVVPIEDAAGRRFPLLNGPVRWEQQPPRPPVAPPGLGEHTDEVLRDWLDFGNERIDELRRAGAVA